LDFTDDQIYRYSRHIILPEVGGKGQRKLLESRVLLIGAGAVGSAVAFYLVAAGLGQVGIADNSAVSLSDLQSQILHSLPDLHRAKTQSAKEKLSRLNPDVRLEDFPGSIIPDHLEQILQNYDLLLDATEEATYHYELNQACVAESRPLVIADLCGFKASIQTVVPGQGPCYRCLHPDPPKTSSRALFGPLAGVVGCLLVTEAIKLLLSKGHPLSERVLEINLLTANFTPLPARRDPDCPVCHGITPAG
jgi:adenylyltransferase/sulfurtransferase